MAAWEGLVTASLRATVYAAVAAAIAALMLSRLRIASPRIHRLAALLVILQGWLIIPAGAKLVLQLPSLSRDSVVAQPLRAEGPQRVVTQNTAGRRPAASTAVASYAPQRPAPAVTAFWPHLVTLAWLVGGGVLVIGYLRGYIRLLARLPLGAPPDRQAWRDEWKRTLAECPHARNVQLRITQDAGPLLCFVPFTFLVLAPRSLWTRLSGLQRQSILRHELAHLMRGDLVKSVLIRILALPQWFNPAVWWAVRRFDEAGEWACDEVAQGRAAANNEYARALLQLAELSVEPIPGVASARGGELAHRVKRLVTSGFKEDTKMKMLLIPMLLGALTVTQVVRVEFAVGEEGAPPRPEVGAYYETAADEGSSGAEQASYTSPRPTKLTKEDLRQAGLAPYRIEPPDVLTIDAGRKGEISGEHLVGPDGRVNLGTHGSVYVAGLTLTEARNVIEERLAKTLKKPQVVLDVFAYNSKVYYVIIQGYYPGDQIHRHPVTGNETVLDALAATDGVNNGSAKKIWISRPAPSGTGTSQVLPVDLQAITQQGNTATNYQLLPGDRVFVAPTPKAKLGTESTQPLSQRAKPLPPAPVNQPLDARRSQIQYDISVIEDASGSLKELKTLQERQAMVSDRESTLGMLRILGKNKLVKLLTSPQVVSLPQQVVTISIGDKGDSQRKGRSIELELQGSPVAKDIVRLSVDADVSRDGNTVELSTTADVPYGKTLLVKFQAAPVYVAVTPRRLE